MIPFDDIDAAIASAEDEIALLRDRICSPNMKERTYTVEPQRNFLTRIGHQFGGALVTSFEPMRSFFSKYNVDQRMRASSQVNQLRTHIRRLKTQRNSLAPICRLPPEILGDIFKLVRNQTTHGRLSDSWTTFPELSTDISWIGLTFVCGRFRDVALAYPALWVNILAHWPEDLSELFLRRSGSHTLSITAIEEDMEDSYKLEKFLKMYASRATAIHLEVDSSHNSSYQHTITQSLPSLRWLKYISHDEYPFGPSFLGGVCHTLTTLQLHSISLASGEGMPELPALRELKVTRLRINHDSEPLFAILSGTPLLESLFLGHVVSNNVAVQPVGDISIHAVTPISLPQLRKIHVASDIVFVCTLLERMPDPSSHFIVDFEHHMFDWEIRDHHVLDMYNKVFDRIAAFWTRKSGESHLPAGCFTFRDHIPFVQFGRDHSDTVYFRSAADIHRTHFFWPHCKTLHLTSIGLLLTETIHSLSRISALTIEIEDPWEEEIKFLREWLLNREYASGIAIKTIHFPRGACIDWEDFIDEIRDVQQDIQVNYASLNTST